MVSGVVHLMWADKKDGRQKYIFFEKNLPIIIMVKLKDACGNTIHSESSFGNSDNCTVLRYISNKETSQDNIWLVKAICIV